MSDKKLVKISDGIIVVKQLKSLCECLVPLVGLAVVAL